jgi:pimeloyl-ACP methyl ester carboxylesterase
MAATPLAYDDTGGSGRPVILLPGAGDVRSENRFLVPGLVEAGYRVINTDLPGHGNSAIAESYGVEEAADALLGLIRKLDSGPASVIATSFAPAAAVWAAATSPDEITAIVAISPHLEADTSPGTRLLAALISVLTRGPWAAPVWSRFYRSWYKDRTPDDMNEQLDKIRAMLRDADRRRAVRETLIADRKGMLEKIEACTRPVLVIFGSADNHFPDPLAEGTRVSTLLHGELVMVPGAGHYPHVEFPEIVSPAVVDFLNQVIK